MGMEGDSGSVGDDVFPYDDAAVVGGGRRDNGRGLRGEGVCEKE